MFFPLVGVILGSMIAALYYLAGFLLPPAAAAAAALVGLVLLTGGIHLDGLMDTLDGVYSGRSRQKKLEIMKDSRVGAFGAAGLFCLLLFKFSLFMGLSRTSALPALIMMTVNGRWAMTYALARFPYAREEGMGRLYVLHTGTFELVLASLTCLLAAAAAGGAGGLIILALTALSAHSLCAYFNRVLDGLTGDTYGALNEIIEVFVLLLYLLLNKHFPLLFPWA
jgi:adenosylcobinamide-GDP ribazoletransferase